MVVETTNKEVITKLSSSVDTEDLQDLLNSARYKELTSGYQTNQTVVDKLASNINEKW